MDLKKATEKITCLIDDASLYIVDLSDEDIKEIEDAWKLCRSILEKFLYCLRCGHHWPPRKEGETPRVCPKCKSPYWNKPRIRR